MKLLTKSLEKKIPKPSEGSRIEPIERKAVMKFFNPTGTGSWYVIEGERKGDDFLFWGYIDFQDKEFGYFTLKDLESMRLPYGRKVERDLYFAPTKISDITYH